MMQIRDVEWGSDAYAAFCGLRQAWLRVPLGLDLYDDDLDAERNQRIFGIYDGEALVGGVIARIESDETAQLRQMIVVPECRGLGYGRLVVRHLENEMLKLGIRRIFLDARTVAADFYERCGYVRSGDEFTHVSIPHVRMEKSLSVQL